MSRNPLIVLFWIVILSEQNHADRVRRPRAFPGEGRPILSHLGVMDSPMEPFTLRLFGKGMCQFWSSAKWLVVAWGTFFVGAAQVRGSNGRLVRDPRPQSKEVASQRQRTGASGAIGIGSRAADGPVAAPATGPSKDMRVSKGTKAESLTVPAPLGCGDKRLPGGPTPACAARHRKAPPARCGRHS